MELRGEKKAEDDNRSKASEGPCWRSTVIEPDTRLRLARGLGTNETQASKAAFIKGRGHPDPALISDGWGGITIIALYGQVPAYKGRGRRPQKKRPVDGWQYLQVVKKRDARGRCPGPVLGHRTAGDLRGNGTGLGALGPLDGLHRTDASSDAQAEQPLGASEFVFFEVFGDASCGGVLGGCVLQSLSCGGDPAGRDQSRGRSV